MNNMTSIELERDRATRRVMRTLARRSATNPLPVKLADGTSPVVVVLPSDRMEEIEARRVRMGGHVNLIVAFPDHLSLLCSHEGLVTDEVADIAPSSTVEMLVSWLECTDTQSGSIRLRKPENGSPKVEEIKYAF